MCCLRKITVAGSLLLLLVVAVPAIKADATDDSNWPTTMTLDESFQIGSQVFAPGTYFFQLTPGTISRHFLMVYSIERGRWEGFFKGVYIYRTDAYRHSGFTFENRNAGEPRALESWFYPGWNRGLKFVSSPTQTAGNTKPAHTVTAAITRSPK